jgi:hypothetical protein
MKNANLASIHERCLLAAIAETEAMFQVPSIGEEIHYFWTYQADAGQPDAHSLIWLIEEISDSYSITLSSAEQVVERVRQIILECYESLDLSQG